MPTLIRSSDIVRLAGLRSASAVSNWRRRPGLDFPKPVAGTSSRPLFDVDEVVAWLKAHDPQRYAALDASAGDQWLLSSFDAIAARSGAEAAIDICLAVLCSVGAENGARVATAFEPTLAGLAGRLSELVEAGAPAGMASLLRDVDETPELDDEIERLLDSARKARGSDLVNLANAVLRRQVRAYARAGGRSGSVDSPLSHLLASLARGRALKDAPTGPPLPAAIPEILAALGISKTKVASVADPACGIGEALLRIARKKSPTQLIASDSDPAAVARLSARLFLEGRAASIEVRGLDDGGALEPVDVVVCEPPLGRSLAVSPTDPRWSFGLPLGAAAEFAWIEDAIARLAPSGRAFVVTSLDTATSTAQASVGIRRQLVGRRCVAGVVSLPAGASSASASACLLWVLGPLGSTDEVAFVDVVIDEAGAARVSSRRVSGARLLEDPRCRLAPRLWVDDQAADAEDAVSRRARALASARAVVDGLCAKLLTLPEATPARSGHVVTVKELQAAKALRIVHITHRSEGENGTEIIESRALSSLESNRAMHGDIARAISARQNEARPQCTQPRDVLIALSSAPIAVVDATGGHGAGRGVLVVRVDEKVLDPDYFALCIKGTWNARFAHGGTAKSALLEFEIPALSLEEQRAFVSEIASVGALEKELQSAQAALAEARRASLDSLGRGENA